MDPGYESNHCLYRGGAGNKFKAKFKLFQRVTIDRLADVMEGGYWRVLDRVSLSKNVKENSKWLIEKKAIFRCSFIFFQRLL